MVCRAAHAKRTFKLDTQRTRTKPLGSLEAMFGIAKAFVEDENLKLM